MTSDKVDSGSIDLVVSDDPILSPAVWYHCTNSKKEPLIGKNDSVTLKINQMDGPPNDLFTSPLFNSLTDPRNNDDRILSARDKLGISVVTNNSVLYTKSDKPGSIYRIDKTPVKINTGRVIAPIGSTRQQGFIRRSSRQGMVEIDIDWGKAFIPSTKCTIQSYDDIDGLTTCNVIRSILESQTNIKEVRLTEDRGATCTFKITYEKELSDIPKIYSIYFFITCSPRPHAFVIIEAQRFFSDLSFFWEGDKLESWTPMRDEVSRESVSRRDSKRRGVSEKGLNVRTLATKIYNLYQSLPCFCVDVKPTNLVWKTDQRCSMGIMIKLIDIDSDKILPGSQFCRKYSEDLSDRDKQPYQRLMLLIFCCFCRQFYHNPPGVSKKNDFLR